MLLCYTTKLIDDLATVVSGLDHLKKFVKCMRYSILVSKQMDVSSILFESDLFAHKSVVVIRPIDRIIIDNKVEHGNVRGHREVFADPINTQLIHRLNIFQIFRGLLFKDIIEFCIISPYTADSFKSTIRKIELVMKPKPVIEPQHNPGTERIKKVIKAYNRQVIFPVKKIETEEELDKYVEEIREQLRTLMKNCDGIELK